MLMITHMETLVVIAVMAVQFLGWTEPGGSTSGDTPTEQTLLLPPPNLDPTGSGRLGDDPKER
jgi:hypothetical protein